MQLKDFMRFASGLGIITACFIMPGESFAAMAGYHFYIANFMDSEMVIIDGGTRKEIGKIKFKYGANPVAVIPSLDKRLLYVANRGIDEVAVIDAKSKEIIKKIKVGLHPESMEITRDGKYMVVVNSQTDHASIVDLTSHEVAGNIQTGRGSLDVAIRDDNRAYVTSAYSDDISVIDLNKMERIAVIPYDKAPETLGPDPAGIIISPDGRFAYICIFFRDRIDILDTATNTIVDHIPVGSGAPSLVPKKHNPGHRSFKDFRPEQMDHPIYIVLLQDGNTAFVVEKSSHAVSAVDLKKKVVIKEIDVGWVPGMPVLSPDGRFLFVPNYGERRGDGSISVIDVDALEEVERLEGLNWPRAIAVLPAPQ